MTFLNPQYFWLLLLLIPIAIWTYFRVKNNDASLQISSLKPLKKAPRSRKIWLYFFPFTLLATALLVVVLARPQTSNSYSNSTTEGINIIIAMDISGSMLARDLSPNRLEAAKSVGVEFVLSRPQDNFGLVVFAGESFTQCPLTGNHAALVNLFKQVDFGNIEDGTAIGLGLATAINRIKDAPGKSKVVILLTDGTNNTGDIAPLSAAEIAQAYGIRVYTIGVGTRGVAQVPAYDAFGNIHYVEAEVVIDENTLQKIAATTGGKYFRATNTGSLKEIYSEIDKMEKTKLNRENYSRKYEQYMPFLMLAFGLILLDALVRTFVLRRLP